MARPMPKTLLIHSATHKSIPTTDPWGNPAWGKTTALTHVRFEPTAKLVHTKDNQSVQLAATMFFDVRNSRPLTAAFAVGDLVEQTSGSTYRIQMIESLNDEKGVHHLEVGLV